MGTIHCPLVRGNHSLELLREAERQIQSSDRWCHRKLPCSSFLDHKTNAYMQIKLNILTVSLKSLLFVGCLTSQQYASVSQGRMCSDKCTCCHAEREVANQTAPCTPSTPTLGQLVLALRLSQQAPG